MVKRESRLIMIILAYLLEIICVLLTYWQFQVLSCSHDPLPAGHSSRHGQFSKQISWAPADIMKQLTINNWHRIIILWFLFYYLYVLVQKEHFGLWNWHHKSCMYLMVVISELELFGYFICTVCCDDVWCSSIKVTDPIFTQDSILVIQRLLVYN